MKITTEYQKTTTETKDFEVDDRIYADDSMAYKIANIILDGKMDALITDLYGDNLFWVERSVKTINDAFKKADEIVEL